MKPKSVITILLLLFVAVTIGLMVSRESRNVRDADVIPHTPAGAEKAVLQPDQSGSATAEKPPATSVSGTKAPHAISRSTAEPVGQKIPRGKIVAYYFHGNTRCTTCRMIEDISRIAISNGFPDEINKGILEFRSVNVEEPGKEHFVQDYRLVTRSLVLARISGEKQERWKNLERVWELVRNPKAFEQYVQDETRTMLEGI